MTFILGLIIGLAFGIIGISYKVGAKGNIYPIQTMTLLCIGGMVFFGAQGQFQYMDVPWVIYAWGAVIGFTQFGGIRLLRKALTIGPLSPAWSAIGLSFVPVIIYSAIFFGEELNIWKILSLFCTGGAIVIASVNQSRTADVKNKESKILPYAFLLILILGFAGIIHIGLKVLSIMPYEDSSLLDVYYGQLMSVVYFTMLVPAVLDLSLSKSWKFNREYVIGGLMCMIGGLGGYALQVKQVLIAPAILAFALPSTVSLLVGSCASVLFFKEKKTILWALSVILAVLAVLLNQ